MRLPPLLLGRHRLELRHRPSTASPMTGSGSAETFGNGEGELVSLVLPQAVADAARPLAVASGR